MQPQIRSRLLLSLICGVLAILLSGSAHIREGGVLLPSWDKTLLSAWSDAESCERTLDVLKDLPEFSKAFPTLGVDQCEDISALESASALVAWLAFVAGGLLWLAARASLPPTHPQRLRRFGVFICGGVLIAYPPVRLAALSGSLLYLSPYALLFQALLQIGYLGLAFWEFLEETQKQPSGALVMELPAPRRESVWLAIGFLAGIVLEMVLGAPLILLRGGAGLPISSLLEGVFIPDRLWPLSPWFENVLFDAASAHFFHRAVAGSLFLWLSGFWIWQRKDPHIAHLLPILFSVYVIQALLGVLTALFLVPAPLSTLHQANALLVFAMSVLLLHRLVRPLRAIAYDMS